MALILCGCTRVSVQSFRDMPALVEPHDAVAIVISDETTDFAVNAEGCVSKALKETFPTLRVISSDDFYRIAFPNTVTEKAVRTSTDISLLLKETAFRERIAPLGLRYLISIQGGTQQKGEPVVGAFGGPGGAATVLGATWDRVSSLNASIMDLKKDQSIGSLWVSASGKPWFICIGFGPLCAPLGAPAFTESEACGSFGEGVARFLKGEELPEPLRIVLIPQLRPSTTTIGSGEKLSLKVIDKRKQDFLGYQTVGGSKIRNSNSLEAVFHESLQKGLSNLGFEVSNHPIISAPNLEFSIENFEYWLAYYANVDAQVKVSLYKRDQSAVEKTYTINNKFDKPSSSPDAKWIEEKINVTISDLISQILADNELIVRLKE